MIRTVPIGFLPLVDAAPLIVASHLGFDREEKLAFDLHPAPSWSRLRDMLSLGHVHAAQMLTPLPIATALGLGGAAQPMHVLQLMSMNGTVIGVSNRLAHRLVTDGFGFDFGDAMAARDTLARLGGDPLRIGVPFPFSMHSELVRLWLEDGPQPQDILTVPPPLMADALQRDEIDLFCVGEPWGSRIVDAGLGSLLLPGCAVWSQAPEKALVVRKTFADTEPDVCARMMRAVWKANRWLGGDGLHTTTAELLARPEYLDTQPEVIDRALSGRLVIHPDGSTRSCPGFLSFFDGAATFPWKSQAAWIGDRIARRFELDRRQARTIAMATFRTDLYRSTLGQIGAVLPGASSKLEGVNAHAVGAASVSGRLILPRNQFFNGHIFNPDPNG